MFCLVVAMLSLVLQYEFQPYKLIAMNTVKVMEAWQNLLCIVVLLIQDADMFANAFVYNIAGVVLVALDIVMICIIGWAAAKRGACRRENLIPDNDGDNDEEEEDEEEDEGQQDEDKVVEYDESGEDLPLYSSGSISSSSSSRRRSYQPPDLTGRGAASAADDGETGMLLRETKEILLAEREERMKQQAAAQAAAVEICKLKRRLVEFELGDQAQATFDDEDK
jgi:hypothetical protein